MGGNVKAHLALLFTAIIAGFNYSISKIVMPEYIQPSAIIAMRGISACLIFGLVHLFIGEKINYKKDFIKILGCAFFGIAANQLLFYEGLNRTSPINASLLQCCVPVFVLIFAVFAKEEKLTFKKIAGIGIGALGAVMLLMSASTQSSGPHFLGDSLIIINALSYGVFLVILKPLMAKYNGLTIVAWIFFLGTFFTLPYGYKDTMAIEWSKWPMYAFFSLAFILIFSTIIAYYLNVSVLKSINPSVAGIYIYLQPVLTTLIAVVLGKDVLTFEKTGYSILIFAGVYLVSRKDKQKQIEYVLERNNEQEGG
jgi:drug/metabolite transporter (DMT)-like permease